MARRKTPQTTLARDDDPELPLEDDQLGLGDHGKLDDEDLDDVDELGTDDESNVDLDEVATPTAPPWEPVRGELCRYTYMLNGPKYRTVEAEIVKVHKDGTLDLDVEFPGGRQQRLERVHRSDALRTANVWSPPA